MCITYEMGYIYFYYEDYIRSCNKNTSNTQKKKNCKYPKIPLIIRGTFKNFFFNPGYLLQSTNKKKKIERTF